MFLFKGAKISIRFGVNFHMAVGKTISFCPFAIGRLPGLTFLDKNDISWFSYCAEWA